MPSSMTLHLFVFDCYSLFDKDINFKYLNMLVVRLLVLY